MSSSVSPPPQTSPYPLVQYTSRHNKGCLKPSAVEREWNFQTHREQERRSAGERNGEITYFVFVLNTKMRVTKTLRIPLCATYQRHVPQFQACCLFIYLSDRTNQRFYFNSICWNCFRAFISGQISMADAERGIHLLSWQLLFPVSQRNIACSTLNNPVAFISLQVCVSNSLSIVILVVVRAQTGRKPRASAVQH